MSYEFDSNHFYRMPTHFGPSLGPRQGLNGRRYPNIETTKDNIIMATFAANPTQLEKLLPPGFVLREPHTISFTFDYITEVEWLAGRGYNLFGVKTPVTYQGEEETVDGDLQLVIWENAPDCIITGREDLGYCKIYCEIPEPQFINGNIICRASWDGCEFVNLTLSNVKEIPVKDFPGLPPSAGTMNYKYIPKTWTLGEADVEYPVLLPNDWPNVVFEKTYIATKAQISFRHSTWEELPTLVHIVNTLANLTIGDCVSAVVTKSHGSKDLSDHRRLR